MVKFAFIIFSLLIECSNLFQNSIESSLLNIPADNSTVLLVTLNKGFDFQKEQILIPEAKGLFLLLKNETGRRKQILYLKSTWNTGKIEIATNRGLKLKLNFFSDASDWDEDGFPDAIELHNTQEREAFTQWFVRIAEAQILKKNIAWNSQEEDCSGLIRYAYKESMKQHDNDWFLKNGISIDKNISDISRFHYPSIPFVGEKIFKINNGTATDVDSFGIFADAKSLSMYHTKKISNSIEDAKKGDLLFFLNENNIHSPYHSMIVVAKNGDEIILLYHSGSKTGLKRIYSSKLDSSNIYNTSSNNSHFLGVHRFHILL